MSQQLLNIGSTINDGTGDTLHTAGLKINSNFTELYAGVQVPAATLATLGTVRPDGSSITISNGIISAVTALFPANTVSIGGVIVPAVATSGLNNSNGTITLATASTTQLGGVKVDGTTIRITNGVITSSSAYTLPKATTSTLGGVVVDGTTITINNTTGVISSASAYTLPTAGTNVLGGVKVDGTSITINGSGVISSGVTGTVVFKGTWNASTNTPTLASGVGTQGWQYAVNVAGTQNLGNGSQTYNVGDFVIYDGANWIDISGSNGVSTFNTRSGAVTLTSSDVTTALGFTPVNNLSVATTTASAGGALTYNAGTFTFAPAVIPTYTVNTGTSTVGGNLSLSGNIFTYNPATAYILPTATDTVLGGIKIDNSSIVINNGVISVGGALTSATIFKGSWNASTNTPTLTSNQITAKAGNEYIVSVAGTQTLGAASRLFNVGDLVIYDGQNWVQIPGSNAVASFNTRTGAITLTSSDVTTALGFTPIQTSSLTLTSNAATGTTSSLAYSNGTFVFTPASPASILGSLTVASSNGFAGSITSSSLTIQTSITGLLKGNGTAISAATAGTDYQAAISVTGVLKSNGTSGNVSAAAASDINSTFGNQTQNYVYAAPASGIGNPTFRALVAADIPAITVAASTLTGTTLANTVVTFASTTTTQTVSIAGGATANAQTNTIQIGTGGASGSTTAITIGSGSGTSTTTFNGGATFNSTVKFNAALQSGGGATNITLTNNGPTLNGQTTGTAATAIAGTASTALGYIGMPQLSKSSAYTTVIGDQGYHIYVTATATITIDSNANVAYPIGTTIAFIAASGATVTIAITSDTMYLGGTGTTGSRTLAPFGMATAVKVAATTWFINGAGLT